MAYDATDFVVTETPAPVVRDPRSITDPRERVAYLRDFLRELPPERFDMASLYSKHGRDTYMHGNGEAISYVKGCGTAACIAGWTIAVFAPKVRVREGAPIAEDLLGLTDLQGNDLFLPSGFTQQDFATPAQAANVLDHYLATGKIDWSVA